MTLRESAWSRLLRLHWIVDRLHWAYHRAYRDPQHAHYDPDVSPHAHSVLRGVDTEAAEQVFHVASRWQVILSTTAPVHQEIFLLLFAAEHNQNHSCALATARVAAGQQADTTSADDPPLPPPPHISVSGGSCSVDAPPARRRRQARPGTPSCVVDSVSKGPPATEPSSSAPAVCASDVRSSSAAARRRLMLGDYCVVNFRSMKVHSILTPISDSTVCGWFCGSEAERCLSAGLQAPGLSYCGTCCGSAAALDR